MEEKLVTGDRWENQFNVTEEDEGRVGVVSVFMMVGDMVMRGVPHC